MENSLTNYERMMLDEYLEAFEISKREKERTAALERLARGEPVAYILGKQYFYNMHFRVTEDTLIPRPDTEHVADMAIKKIANGGHFIDLCTGSGCIALTILYNRPDLMATAVDISEKALSVAAQNASDWKLEDRVSFVRSDILNSDAESGKFDAVISNPPYIVTDAMKDYPSLKYEPRIALDCGDDGMIFYRSIIDKYSKRLNENGFFLFEIGYDQGKEIEEVARIRGFSCEVYKDFSKNDRVALLRKKHL